MMAESFSYTSFSKCPIHYRKDGALDAGDCSELSHGLDESASRGGGYSNESVTGYDVDGVGLLVAGMTSDTVIELLSNWMRGLDGCSWRRNGSSCPESKKEHQPTQNAR